MNDFDYEVLQKKRLARNAQHKKNGSKSKKCTLPHENMTRKELNAMNGKIKSYNLNRPMSFAELKAMPEDLQREYLCKLRTQFHVTGRPLGEMLGVSHNCVNELMHRLGITISKSDRMTTDERVAWAAWLGKTEKPAEPTDTETAPEEPKLEEVKVEAVSDSKPTEDDTESLPSFGKPVLRNGSLYFEGNVTSVMSEILRFLKAYRGKCRVTLKFHFDV